MNSIEIATKLIETAMNSTKIATISIRFVAISIEIVAILVEIVAILVSLATRRIRYDAVFKGFEGIPARPAVKRGEVLILP